MSKAIRLYETGGPEVLKWEEFDPGKPDPDEVLLRHEAVGLNFIDVYHRTGLYPLPALPAIPGMEGAGIVEQVGSDVAERFLNHHPRPFPPSRTSDQPRIPEGGDRRLKQ